MNIKILVLIALPLSIFASLAAYFLYNDLTTENIIILNMSVRVDDHFGLNADQDALKFGRLMPDTAGERKIIIENNASHQLTVSILKEGTISGWVTISDNNFIMAPDETKIVTFVIHAPEVDYGDYQGTVTVIFKKPLFS